MIPALVLSAIFLSGYVTGRLHAWFLELVWRDSAGRRLRAVAHAEQAPTTAAAIAEVLELSEGHHG